MSQASRQRRRRRLHCKKRLGHLANRKQLQLQLCSSVLLQCMHREREREQSQAFDSISQWAHLAAAAAAAAGLLIMSMTYE